MEEEKKRKDAMAEQQQQQQQQGFDMSAIDLSNPTVRKMLSDSMTQYGSMATADLRPAEYEKVKSERIRIEMPDGIKLSAFLTMPEEKKAYPVILVRNPYVSNSFVYEGILPIFSRYGYATLLVEVRGSQTSEGEWLPFENEIGDGRAVLDWIAEQEWCNGSIGCFGGSYLGHVQWAVANSRHPALKSLFIQVYGPTPYNTFWRRGMFRQDVWSVWVTQMMGENRKKAAPPREQLQECIFYRPQDGMGEHFIGEHVDWYTDWITNSRPTDPYWTEGFWGEFYRTAEEAAVPILLEGGWNDIFLRPEIEAFRRLPKEIRAQSRFLIGPWNHGGQCNGDLACPNSRDDILFIREGVEWFDYTLRGMDYAHPLGKVETYQIGGDGYLTWEGDISHSCEKTIYLAENGTLRETPGKAGSANYTYDPENCPENLWGNILGDGSDPTYGGPRKQRPVGSRSDELYFVSEPMEEELEISGAVRAELYVSSDVEATAFSITVSEVYENGDAINIRNDITDIRFQTEESRSEYVPGSMRKLSITMLDIEWKLRKGSALRVDIASSNHPAYHIHPNTTECWATVTTSEIAHQTVYYGKDQASCVILPLR